MTSPNASESPALELRALRVEYDQLVAVKDVSLKIYPGMIFGLLGPNGAGKTSLMSCVAGLVEATYGEVLINGLSLHDQRAEALASLGFQPDVPPMAEGLTVYEFLELFASAYGLKPSIRAERIESLLALVKLTEHRSAYAQGLSRGMRQRLFLAKTMLPSPRLMILDEPASGLDPMSRRDLAELIKRLAKEGVAVVISSHVLEELNGVCDSLAVMANGEVLDQGRIEEVRARLNPPPELELRFLEGVSEECERRVRGYFGARLQSLTALGEPAVGYRAQLHAEEGALGPERLATDLKGLITAGLSPTRFVAREANLQDIFLTLAERHAQGELHAQPRGGER
jgi:ABC-2 type transport system ATP-binding protein